MSLKFMRYFKLYLKIIIVVFFKLKFINFFKLIIVNIIEYIFLGRFLFGYIIGKYIISLLKIKIGFNCVCVYIIFLKVRFLLIFIELFYFF